MDELKEVWGSIKNDTEDFTNLTEEEIKANASAKSSGTIEKLRKNVKYKLGYAIGFAAVFGTIIPYAFPLASQILLTVMFVAYMVGAIFLYQELQILNKGVNMDQDMLHGLIEYRDRIRRVLRYEESTALALYPVSVSGGFFLGMQIVDRDAQIMTQTFHWVALIVTIVLFTIGGNWLAKWMNRRAFGKYLERLDETIGELQSTREQ
ncbi:MAG: hypothetical protein RIC35_04610 [Marinoscillum sp.]